MSSGHAKFILIPSPDHIKFILQLHNNNVYENWCVNFQEVIKWFWFFSSSNIKLMYISLMQINCQMYFNVRLYHKHHSELCSFIVISFKINIRKTSFDMCSWQLIQSTSLLLKDNQVKDIKKKYDYYADMYNIRTFNKLGIR